MAYSKHTNPKRFLDVLSSLQVPVQPFSMSLSEDDSLCPSSGLKTRWPCRHAVVVYKSKVLFLDFISTAGTVKERVIVSIAKSVHCTLP